MAAGEVECAGAGPPAEEGPPENNNYGHRGPFQDPEEERLFVAYRRAESATHSSVFLCAGALALNERALWLLLATTASPLATVSLFVPMGILVLLVLLRSCLSPRMGIVFPLLAWALATLPPPICIYLLAPSDFPVSQWVRACTGWLLLLSFLPYVTLPLHKWACPVLGTIPAALLLLAGPILSTGTNEENYALWEGIGAQATLLVCCHLLGLLSHYMAEAQQRRAFTQARQAASVHKEVAERTREQERLLLAVLPAHLAQQMVSEWGQTEGGPFKKMYLSRHENVSILYADIVGFTAISSTYAASDLVRMLNHLFAKFDRLSKRFHQLRIKILGDCYYCICGAPEERSDHAELCVRMGLAMVDAIQETRETTGSPVDMRVGIHTGAILAGVLGQRQWQFDVFSRDAQLANKMESSGMPGRVHISESTLRFMEGTKEFVVEPAYAEKREEALRNAGLQTYFVTARTEAPASPEEEEEDEDMNRPPQENLQQLPNTPSAASGHWLTLRFNNVATERRFVTAWSQEGGVPPPSIGCPLAVTLTSASQAIVLPRDLASAISFSVGLPLVSALALLSAAAALPHKAVPPRSNWGTLVTQVPFRAVAAALIVTMAVINMADVWVCFLPPSPCAFPFNPCSLSSYFSLMLIPLLEASALLPMEQLPKTGIMMVVALGQAIIAVWMLPAMCPTDINSSSAFLPCWAEERWTCAFVVLGAALALALLNRHTEMAARTLFVAREAAEEQREKSQDLRRRNEALLLNLLPGHVASHFLGMRTKDPTHLYSHSFDAAGILFASMPNFADFYTEEDVNNQGLECLRLLNEVISDFDAILERPEFDGNISKIKTIGSTYMAASGLDPSRQPKEDDPPRTKWAHLSLLIQFALNMQRTLAAINEQSFNHFVLQMGINHGPVTAGVIGCTKPHYDIWGNSVNVASRMESTGKAGSIQVTEETKNIVEEFGYTFQQRGLVAVKGKGQLMTFYLIPPDK